MIVCLLILNILESLGLQHYSTEKLIPNLNNKLNYVVHETNLGLYQELGLEVLKIHRVLEFDQSDWLKPFIDFNTEKRKLATSTFESDFFKLFNNATFGKTMENLRKRINVKLVSDKHKMKKLIAKPEFHSFKIFTENLAGIHLKKTSITLNKPIYLGFCILDISKALMYDFHYNVMKKKYGSKIQLCLTDTDSFLYDIETEDACLDMTENMEIFDTSNYPKDHFLFNLENKKVLGKIKDETAGVPPLSLVGLRSKMYSFKVSEETEKILEREFQDLLYAKI